MTLAEVIEHFQNDEYDVEDTVKKMCDVDTTRTANLFYAMLQLWVNHPNFREYMRELHIDVVKAIAFDSLARTAIQENNKNACK